MKYIITNKETGEEETVELPSTIDQAKINRAAKLSKQNHEAAMKAAGKKIPGGPGCYLLPARIPGRLKAHGPGPHPGTPPVSRIYFCPPGDPGAAENHTAPMSGCGENHRIRRPALPH